MHKRLWLVAVVLALTLWAFGSSGSARVAPGSGALLPAIVSAAWAEAEVDVQADPNQPKVGVHIETGDKDAPAPAGDAPKAGAPPAGSINPIWFAVGGVAALLVIVLIVMAARGGDTTVIHDRH